jgi:hypothetical protein
VEAFACSIASADYGNGGCLGIEYDGGSTHPVYRWNHLDSSNTDLVEFVLPSFEYTT